MYVTSVLTDKKPVLDYMFKNRTQRRATNNTFTITLIETIHFRLHLIENINNRSIGPIVLSNSL